MLRFLGFKSIVLSICSTDVSIANDVWRFVGARFLSHASLLLPWEFSFGFHWINVEDVFQDIHQKNETTQQTDHQNGDVGENHSKAKRLPFQFGEDRSKDLTSWYINTNRVARIVRLTVRPIITLQTMTRIVQEFRSADTTIFIQSIFAQVDLRFALQPYVSSIALTRELSRRCVCIIPWTRTELDLSSGINERVSPRW